MRSILCAAMLALATTTAGAEEFDYSANNMLPYCKAFANEGMHTTTMTNAVGASYCNGMISMLVYLTPSLEVWPEECMQSPKGATTPQIARVIVRYVEARPQRMHELFFQLAVEALHNAWPRKSAEFDQPISWQVNGRKRYLGG